MSDTKKISVNDLAKILEDQNAVNGCTFIGFDALTEPKLNKTIPTNEGRVPNPDFGKIIKSHTGQVAMLFSNTNVNGYENMINRRKEADGDAPDFKVGERAWGVRTEGTSVVRHKDKVYLQLIYTQQAKTLVDFAQNDLGIDLSSADQELIDKMKQDILSYETRNGSVQWMREGQPTKKADVLGQPPKKEGKQGGLAEEKKVPIRTFTLSNLTRVALNGTTYLIEN